VRKMKRRSSKIWTRSHRAITRKPQKAILKNTHRATTKKYHQLVVLKVKKKQNDKSLYENLYISINSN
jgi:hypothetical protein